MVRTFIICLVPTERKKTQNQLIISFDNPSDVIDLDIFYQIFY